MNWIYYYIEREQTEHPSISKTPYDVLEDLIYKNSNKFYDVLNKDFYNNLDKYFNTKQSFNEKIENYKRTEAYKDWIDYLTRVNLEANHLHKNILKHEIKEITNEEAFQLAINKDNAHYNNLIRIDKCWNKLLDQDFAFNTIIENRFSPYLSIKNENYFIQNQYNENTNKDLLEISYFLNNVYIKVMNYLLENKDKIVSPFNPINPSEKQINDIVGNYIENIKILENSNNLIKTYLDNYLELQLSSF